MNPVLLRLAQRVHGQGRQDLVRPRLASRFADAAGAVGSTEHGGDSSTTTIMPAARMANADAAPAPRTATPGPATEHRETPAPVPVEAIRSPAAAHPADTAIEPQRRGAATIVSNGASSNTPGRFPFAPREAPATAALPPSDRHHPDAPAPVELLVPDFRPPLPREASVRRQAAAPDEARADARLPDIHVSIGRIEVRTEREERRAQPAPPQRRQPATMSLEDYLSGRGGKA